MAVADINTIKEIQQGLLEKNIMINIPVGAVIFRGVKEDVTDLTKSYSINGSTWFTTDSAHDFICAPKYKRGVYTIRPQLSEYGLINLQHPVMRDLLNRAIDRFSEKELKEIATFATKKFPENKDASIDASTIKSNLKSVYGGISMQEQMKLMNTEIFYNRLQRTSSLFNIMKSNLKNSGFRHSTTTYDALLLHIIVKILPQKYPIFVGIIGWFHDPWDTPWHDKEKDKIHVFKQEIAMIIPSDIGDPFTNMSFQDVTPEDCSNTNPQPYPKPRPPPPPQQPGGARLKKRNSRKK